MLPKQQMWYPMAYAVYRVDDLSFSLILLVAVSHEIVQMTDSFGISLSSISCLLRKPAYPHSSCQGQRTDCCSVNEVLLPPYIIGILVYSAQESQALPCLAWSWPSSPRSSQSSCTFCHSVFCYDGRYYQSTQEAEGYCSLYNNGMRVKPQMSKLSMLDELTMMRHQFRSTFP